MADRPSLTARTIAMARAVGTDGLADPLAARALGQAGTRLAAVLREAQRRPGLRQASTVAVAGLNVHAALRMAAVDAAVESAANDGCRQLVVVGAGFDTRAWRLAALADTTVVEVDLPATQQAKRAALADLEPITLPTFVAADLARDRLGDVLAPTPWDPDAATTWLWEAVAPYLPPAAVEATAQTLGDLSAAGSRLVMTFAAPPGGQGLLSPVREVAARAVFRAIGEPLRATHDDFDVVDLVTRAGFTEVEVTGGSEWARTLGRPRPRTPFGAERLVVARRG